MSIKCIIGTMAAGAAIGFVAGMLVDPLNDKQHKKVHREASNMFRAIGTIVDDIIS